VASNATRSVPLSRRVAAGGAVPGVPVAVPESVMERGRRIAGRLIQDEQISLDEHTVVGGSIYAACKEAGVPVRADEVSAVVGCCVEDVYRVSRCVQRSDGVGVVPVPVAEFVDRYLDEVGVADRGVRASAMVIARRVDELGVSSGWASSTVAAAVVYIAASEFGDGSVSQRDVSRVAGVGEQSVRYARDVVRGGVDCSAVDGVGGVGG